MPLFRCALNRYRSVWTACCGYSGYCDGTTHPPDPSRSTTRVISRDRPSHVLGAHMTDALTPPATDGIILTDAAAAKVKSLLDQEGRDATRTSSFLTFLRRSRKSQSGCRRTRPATVLYPVDPLNALVPLRAEPVPFGVDGVLRIQWILRRDDTPARSIKIDHPGHFPGSSITRSWSPYDRRPYPSRH